MKMTLNTFAPITVLLTAFLIPPATLCRAQSEPETASLAAVSAMPASGCFWSLQLTNFPPWPFNPFPDLPLFTDGSGNFYYDDRSVDYAALWSAGAASSSVIVSGGMAQVQGPPAPGGGSGGSGGGATVIVSFTPPASGYFPCQTWTNFWLEIQASANVLDITISH